MAEFRAGWILNVWYEIKGVWLNGYTLKNRSVGVGGTTQKVCILFGAEGKIRLYAAAAAAAAAPCTALCLSCRGLLLLCDVFC